jgi:DNA polymerase-4
VFEVFERTAPVVEKLSIDEAFLDVRGLQRISGSPPEIAGRLRRDVREQVGLPLTVGVARTRVVAKMASGAAKPDGLLVVPAGGELAFLHPLKVEAVWGVGPATARRLHRGGIRTVGEAARVPEDALVALLGRAAGRYLHAIAHNREPRRARTSRGRRSFGAQSALSRASRTRAGLESVLVALVERVTRRMRAAGRSGRTMILRLRFDDFSRASRSHTLARPTAETRILLAAAQELLAAAMPAIRRRGITLLGVTVTNLDGDGGQLRLPFDGRAGPALDAVLDELRDRFGAQAIVRAALVGRGGGLAPWKSLEEASTPLAHPRRAPRGRGRS